MYKQKAITVEQAIEYSKQNSEAFIRKLVNYICTGELANETFGRLSFDEDVCPIGLQNICIVYCQDGHFVIFFNPEKDYIRFYDHSNKQIWVSSKIQIPQEGRI